MGVSFHSELLDIYEERSLSVRMTNASRWISEVSLITPIKGLVFVSRGGGVNILALHWFDGEINPRSFYKEVEAITKQHRYSGDGGTFNVANQYQRSNPGEEFEDFVNLVKSREVESVTKTLAAIQFCDK